MKPDVIQSLVNEINDDPTVLALLCGMQDDAMMRLIRACVEMDPEHRHGIAGLIEGLKISYEEVIIENVVEVEPSLETV